MTSPAATDEPTDGTVVGRGCTRRTFVAGLGAASVVLVAAACQPVSPTTGLPATGPGSGSGPSTAPPTTAPPTTAAPAPVPSDPFLRAAWSPLVGQAVALVGAAGTVPAVLDAVLDVGPEAGHERCFALTFRSDSGSRLDEVDRVRTAASGQRSIVALPTDRGADHRWYQAVVFNPTS